MENKKKRIAIFASFSKKKQIADYVVYYLKALHKVTDTIIFVADNDMKREEADKLSGTVLTTICRRHGMYDFGSYRIGYFWALEHHLLDETDELIFANDSCYGPVFPFEKIFEKMDEKECDFWGLTDSYEERHHLLSFFLVFKKNVFTSLAFHNFVSNFTKQESFWDYVNLYEKIFTELLENNRFKSAVYIDIDENTRKALSFKCGHGNLTSFPVFLHDQGMPLVKIKAMNGAFGFDLHESPHLLLQKIKRENPELHDIIKKDLCTNGVQTEDKWITPEEIIGDAKVVSFDIFDTLLTRPYIKPTDLFLHIEEMSGLTGFREHRIEAEKIARRRHKEQADVTFDQIYEEVSTKYKHLKTEELRYEKELLSPKKDTLEIYNEAVRQGKTIIAISDMYLPQDFLESVLKEKGYTQISRVFVSNEEGCCKGDGLLFEKVLKTLGIESRDIVHIGDNYDADKKMPERLGIRAYCRPTDVQTMFDNPAMAKFKSFVQNSPCLASSVLTGIFARHHAKEMLLSPFTELGYYLGGPLAVGYCMHIHKVAKERGNDAILFVSRDGYALHLVYQKLFPNDIPSYYIYASRKLILRNSVNYDNEQYLKNICEIYSKECLHNKTITIDDIEQYKEAMEKWAATNAEHYRKYVDSMHIKGKKMMSVDMTTKAYTSLNMLHSVFGDRIDCGMFSITYGEPSNYTTLSYAERFWRNDDKPFMIMQEELITAPEPSALSIDKNGCITFATHNPIEDYRVEKYKETLEGIENFADDYIQMTAGHHTSLTFEFWLKLFKSYLDLSNFGDHELLKLIYHDDIGQNTYDNLYDICIKKTTNQNNIGESKLFQKNKKHLKVIRKLIIALSIEAAIIISLLVALLTS